MQILVCGLCLYENYFVIRFWHKYIRSPYDFAIYMFFHFRLEHEQKIML